MTIETKFNIGDEAWFMHFGEIKKGMISHIDVYVKQYSVKPYYWIIIEPSDKAILKFEDEELYRNKQELLDSL